MGVQCQILINKAREGVFRPGQAITGRVKFFVDEPTEYKHVLLSLLGKGKCMWTTGAGKSRRTHVGKEKFILQHINVVANVTNPDEQPVTLSGKYEHSFEFFLPQDIPRSYKDPFCSITYHIKLLFEKPSFFSFNKVFKAEIPVYSYVTPSIEGPIVFGLEKNPFSLFSESATINLKAEIQKSCLSPGENIHISYTIRNDSDLQLDYVLLELYSITTYTAEDERTKVVEDKVKTCEVRGPCVLERVSRTLSCVLPTLPDLYSIQETKIISKAYAVRVTVHLPLPHRNASVDMPVIIGEQRGATNDTLELEDTEPPSYWESMNEKEKKNKTK